MTTAARRVTGPAAGACGLIALLVVATLPPSQAAQWVLGAAALAVALAVTLAAIAGLGQRAAVPLLALGAGMAARYLFWRAAMLAEAPIGPGWIASLGLLGVELAAYALAGRDLLRRACPLRRPPWPLPPDPDSWPAVDVCVLARGEPIAAVRASLLASAGLDWPAERLRVWLLDRGGRPELRELAHAAGWFYVAGARPAERQAPFVAVIAAGDMPVRAFLQLTLGWLLARPDLAFVQAQTAATGAAAARQDGADLFGATRFAGSGGVLRRAALDATGLAPGDPALGRALHRRGWRGAFLALPLAGGRPAARARPPLETGVAVLAACVVLLLPLAPVAELLAYALPPLAILGASLAVLRRRAASRAAPASPVEVTGPAGPPRHGHAAVLRPEGATLRLDRALAPGVSLRVRIAVGDERHEVGARATGPAEIAWAPATLAEEARLVRAVFGRADTWLAAAALCLMLAAALPAAAQTGAGQAGGGQAGDDTVVRPVPGAPAEAAPASPPPTAPLAAPASVQAGTRTVVYTLHQLGAGGPLALRGTQPVLALPVGVRADEVVTAATLTLDGAISPALLPDLSNITVTLNGQYLTSIPADRRTPAFTADVPIMPALFRATNRIEFRLAGRAQADCDDPLSPLLWATIADSSTLTLTFAQLPPQRDLARLPAPFFDAGAVGGLVLPFVLPEVPDSAMLQAAGIAASWFGQLAGAAGARFPAASELPDSGDAVLLQVAAEGGDGPLPDAPPIDGPTLAVLPNPHDALGSVLLIAGRTDAEAVIAARALAFGIRALSGATATVEAPEVSARTPYDAPAWIGTGHPVRLGTLADAASLQGSGYAGQLSVPFRTAPDLYSWGGEPFALDLRWRAPPAPIEDASLSRLDVGIDGDYLASLPLAADGSATVERHVALPADDLAGDDTLQLAWDARPLRRSACAAIPGDLRFAVDPDSTLDLTRAHHVARLPNLGFFAAAGFPFTRLADLSQTAIVLPEQPQPAEIGAFLDAMGRFGAATGLPAAAAAVVRPGEVSSVADRDLLVIGTLAGLQSPGLAGLLDGSPVGFADGRLHVRLGAATSAWMPVLDRAATAERARATAVVAAGFGSGVAVLVGAESPLQAGRSVVALVAADAAALQAADDVLADPAQRRRLQGDLALLSGGQVTAWRVGATYTVGALPIWLWPAWTLADRPLLEALLLLGGCGLLAAGLSWWLAARRAARRRPPGAP